MKTGSVVTSGSRAAGGLYESVRGLHQAFYELPDTTVEVFAVEDEFDSSDLPAWAPVKVTAHKCLGPKIFSFAPALKRALLQSDVDILQAHGIWQYPSMAVADWHGRTGRPYLVSPHGMLDPWAVKHSAWKKRLALTLYERRHLEGAACLRALCESEAQSIRAFGLKNPICIIPNGIDLPIEENTETLKTDTLKSASPACRGFSFSDFTRQGRKVLLYLGRIHPKKGLVNLLRAWRQAYGAACDAGSQWMLAIVGWDQGRHEAELKRLATELGIQWADVSGRAETLKTETLKGEVGGSAFQDVSIFFVGPQFGEAKAACYRDCDAFILPSFSEGLPMAVLEAWAYSKPVLMTPECNLPEGFAAGAAIRIETTPDSIARGLSELLSLPSADLCSLGQRGRAMVATKFTWVKIAQDMRAVYEWVLGGGTKPGCVKC